MPVSDFNHFFIRSKDIERTRQFYCDALGFSVMPRPDFAFPGYWLGVGGKIQLHIGLDAERYAGQHYFGTTPASARNNSGVIDHIAFQCADVAAMAQRLASLGLPTRTRHIAQIALFQIFVTDPDGVMIELNFPGVAQAPTL